MTRFQSSASGANDRSFSHFVVGMAGVLSDTKIILYILERSLFDELILIKSELAGGGSRLMVVMLYAT